MLNVPNGNVRYAVETLLLRCAGAGLQRYFDRMAAFVLRLVERRFERAQRTLRNDAVIVERSAQWWDFVWLWIVFGGGVVGSMGVFVVVELKVHRWIMARY